MKTLVSIAIVVSIFALMMFYSNHVDKVKSKESADNRFLLCRSIAKNQVEKDYCLEVYKANLQAI